VDVGGFPYVPSGLALLTGALSAAAAAIFTGPNPLVTLPGGLPALSPTTALPKVWFSIAGLVLVAIIAILALFTVLVRLFLSEARPFTSSAFILALTSSLSYTAHASLVTLPLYASAVTLPGVFSFPTAACVAVGGSVVGFAVGESLKAPFYYYVAQKRHA